MFKRFGLYTVLVIILAVLLFLSHQYFLSGYEDKVSFSIVDMYVFHFVSYIVICLGVEYLANKLPSQVGYAYLASVFVKIGLFVLIFKSAIFSEAELTMPERLSIVIPMFVFLILEAVYCGRLMNSK